MMSTFEIKITEAPTCPHCKALMEKLDARYLEWGTPFLWVCFNDSCAFFVRGWKHISENFGQGASYRFMITPDSGQANALPWFGVEYIMKKMGVLNPQEAPEEE
jgi:hypothetical protein